MCGSCDILTHVSTYHSETPVEVEVARDLSHSATGALVHILLYIYDYTNIILGDVFKTILCRSLTYLINILHLCTLIDGGASLHYWTDIWTSYVTMLN